MRNNQKGQAILLVVLALGVFLIGAVGLVIDGAQMYAHREMAQAAADAAAQAAIFSVFAGTWPVPSGATSHTCASTDTSTPTTSIWGTPCTYALSNGFMTSGDTVTVTFLTTSTNGVIGSPDFTYPFAQVTVVRTLQTTFMQFLGSSSSSVKAVGTAGIVQKTSAIPAIALHPSLAGSFSVDASSTLTVCGGSNRGIQLNSMNSAALAVSGTVDLSHAGPEIAGNCSAGTGADFGNFGGPTSDTGISLGTTGHYVQPAAPIRDPFLSVAAPPNPGTPALAPSPILSPTDGCPSTCTLYYPGLYPIGLPIFNTIAIFTPGVYYLTGNFSVGGNSQLMNCTVCGSSLDTGNKGMLVYISGTGTFTISGNATTPAGTSLLGSDPGSAYRGILFFSDHGAPNQVHSFTNNGAIPLQLNGTIYLTNGANTTTSVYQTASWSGNPCNSSVSGIVVADAISLSNACVQFSLPNYAATPAYKLPLDQVALIQ